MWIIHMNCQDFSKKKKTKKNRSSASVVIGAWRVNYYVNMEILVFEMDTN